MRNLKAVLEYDGTGYLGWQLQPRGPTVQGELEAALEALTGTRVRVIGSGRTDAGVHARGQVASFRVARAGIATDRLAAALNAHLSPDIAVLSVTEAAADFHARFDARAKHYRYVVLERRARAALDRHRVGRVPVRLDAAAMQRAAARLVGRRDFRSFATAASGGARRGGERELYVAAVRRLGDRVVLDFVASGFLHNMARCLAGTLVEIGRGRWPEDEVDRIVAARDRRAAGPNLPPGGLTLMQVFYREFSPAGWEPPDDEPRGAIGVRSDRGGDAAPGAAAGLTPGGSCL
ncbi:MAG: tRNA pseudouridine(38-40) synthase TruA [Planctomycetes bacterium]|nr:tRNA pseudouridine(38-40) synthase TruA [Planctomycetota bacterium]